MSDPIAQSAPRSNPWAPAPTRRALIIVDVQNDFCEGGSLPVAGGLAVAEKIASYLETNADDYDLIIASRDWHHDPEDDPSQNNGHFAAPGTAPDYVTTWPVHCVAETPGSAFAPPISEAIATHADTILSKGRGFPAYSAFQGTNASGHDLSDLLPAPGITAVDVCGIATDYCVKATALDAVGLGYEVTLLPGLHAGVAPETTAAAIGEMAGNGVTILEGAFKP